MHKVLYFFEANPFIDSVSVKSESSLGLESHFHADYNFQTRQIGNYKSGQWQFGNHVLISRYFLSRVDPGNCSYEHLTDDPDVVFVNNKDKMG